MGDVGARVMYENGQMRNSKRQKYQNRDEREREGSHRKVMMMDDMMQ